MVHYTFNKVLTLQEPLLVGALFYTLFFLHSHHLHQGILLHHKGSAAGARMRVACITEQTLVSKQIRLYHDFDETLSKCKQSLNSVASLEMEHKALASGISLLQSRPKTECSDLCDRVNETQKLDAQVTELVLSRSRS